MISYICFPSKINENPKRATKAHAKRIVFTILMQAREIVCSKKRADAERSFSPEIKYAPPNPRTAILGFFNVWRVYPYLPRHSAPGLFQRHDHSAHKGVENKVSRSS
jgi:hypothetical protein